MNELSVKQGVSEHTLNSWEEFGGYIASAHANSPAYLYRGQADVEWRVESALDRMESRYPKTKNYWGKNPEYFDCPPAARDVHLEAFKEAVRGKRGPSPHALSEDEWWALAQHHGLATPLLDWTYSPFVALFFAFEHEGYVNFTTQSFQIPDRRAVYFVPFHLITQNGTDADPAPSVFSPRREISHRLSSQSGVFMRMPKGSDLESSVRRRFPDESSTNNRHARAILTRISIPNAGRKECLCFLNKMNINRMSLFSDLDGAAKYINGLWELDFDTALGALPDGAVHDDR